MAVPAAGQEAPVTDMATGLGGTASCPSCGAQVEVAQRAGAAGTPCPKCGAVVSAGPAPDVQGEETLDEVLRGFGVNGYDADLEVDGRALRCPACGATSAADRFRVVDVTPATHEIRGADVIAAALVCPGCGAPGRIVLDPAVEDEAAVADALLPPA